MGPFRVSGLGACFGGRRFFRLSGLGFRMWGLGSRALQNREFDVVGALV